MEQAEGFNRESWASVLAAMDSTYSELVAHQGQLEEQNAELLSYRGLLESILGSIHDVMLVLDRDGQITDVSQSFADFTGHSSETLKSRRFIDAIDDMDRTAMSDALLGLRLQAVRQTLEARLVGATSTEPFDFTVSPRLDARRRVIGAVVLGRPLGELRRAYEDLAVSHETLKQTQAQLVRNEKLAGLGRLLAGVAHELNNPISFVYANTHALERYIAKFETYFAEVMNGAPRERLVALRDELNLERSLKNLRTAIDGANEGSERVRDIVDDLRRLSSSGSGEHELFDLVETSKVAARWVERGSKSGITPEFDGIDSLQVRGNPGHIQQIVMNLVQNAMDALKGIEAPKLTVSISRGEDQAELTVSDNGPGVSADVAASIFDPFVTTKGAGEGTGLGLAICLKIAEEHGGNLTLANQEGGAVFLLTLPLEAKS